MGGGAAGVGGGGEKEEEGSNRVPRSFPLEIERGKALGTRLGEGGREQRISVETSLDCSAKF